MKLTCAFLLALTLAPAQSERPIVTEKSRVGTGVNDPVIDFYDSMADYFRNSPRAVHAINDKGIPPEEIPALLLIARRSPASPNQLIEARKSGKSWKEIAQQHGVKLEGDDFVKEANILFLSEYHQRPIENVRALHAKGANFVQINQEYRRVGGPPRKTEAEKSRSR